MRGLYVGACVGSLSCFISSRSAFSCHHVFNVFGSLRHETPFFLRPKYPPFSLSSYNSPLSRNLVQVTAVVFKPLAPRGGIIGGGFGANNIQNHHTLSSPSNYRQNKSATPSSRLLQNTNVPSRLIYVACRQDYKIDCYIQYVPPDVGGKKHDIIGWYHVVQIENLHSRRLSVAAGLFHAHALTLLPIVPLAWVSSTGLFETPEKGEACYATSFTSLDAGLQQSALSLMTGSLLVVGP